MPDYEAYDQQIIMHINTALAAATQIGVGPTEGFVIRDANTTWDELIGNDKRIEAVKSYIYMKVRLAFDPPQNGNLIESFKEQITEIEWRLISDLEHEPE